VPRNSASVISPCPLRSASLAKLHGRVGSRPRHLFHVGVERLLLLRRPGCLHPCFTAPSVRPQPQCATSSLVTAMGNSMWHAGGPGRDHPVRNHMMGTVPASSSRIDSCPPGWSDFPRDYEARSRERLWGSIHRFSPSLPTSRPPRDWAEGMDVVRISIRQRHSILPARGLVGTIRSREDVAGELAARNEGGILRTRGRRSHSEKRGSSHGTAS
jgi:hypothetical protein